MNLVPLLRSYFLRFAPTSFKHFLKRKQLARKKEKIRSFPALSANEFQGILEDLGVRKGAVVFVHNSLDLLHLDFPANHAFRMLVDFVGPDGTVVFPTFPKLDAYTFLKSGSVFEARRTPGYTGLLGEIARRDKRSLRSLHPTRSVVAIGKYAESIVCEHHDSLYPYDSKSPFYKLIELDAVIVGLGVSTKNLSFVHVVDDLNGGRIAREIYHPQKFYGECLSVSGERVVVSCYAHDLKKMKIDVPAFVRKYVSVDIARDLTVGPMQFFTVKAKPFFERLVKLSRENVTIYQN